MGVSGNDYDEITRKRMSGNSRFENWLAARDSVRDVIRVSKESVSECSELVKEAEKLKSLSEKLPDGLKRHLSEVSDGVSSGAVDAAEAYCRIAEGTLAMFGTRFGR